MPFNPLLPQMPTIPLVGVTANPATVQNTDGNPSIPILGRQGEVLVDSVRGKYGAMAHRHGVFVSQVTTAATSIPVITTTNASTFALINPSGSGVKAELIRFKLDFLSTNAAPATANIIGWSLVNNTLNANSAITKMADPISAGGHAVDLSGVSPQAYVASAVTFASALTIAANFERSMFSFPASWVPTVGGYPVPLFYDFDGTLMVPPGFTLTLVASTAWGSNTVAPHLTWAEYLI
jgi:hypothetical protein